MVSSFRRWLMSVTGTRRKRRNLENRRSWITQGVERLEGRAMFACMPPSDVLLGPQDLELSPQNLAENLAPGTTIGSFTTTGDDAGGPFRYSFEGGPENLDNEHFFLTGDVIKTRTALDFESISSYQVSIKTTDADGNSLSKIFTIGVNDEQEAPIAVDDAVLTAEDTPVSGNVLANDSDDAGDVLSASLDSEPAHGMVELQSDGSFTYTPEAGYAGEDSFTYLADDGHGTPSMATVMVTIDPVNDAPVAGDDAYSTDEDQPLSGNVLVNDTDADGDAMSTALGEGPTSGTVEMNSDGSFTYTPNADFNGNDSFTYTVDDGNGGAATGTVNITIGALNDAPIAGDDAFTTDEDLPLSGNVLVNDTDADGDAMSTALGEAPTNGTVEMNTDGSFTYTPNADFNGSDSFTYTVDDGNGGTATGMVSIEIAAINDGPTAGDDSYSTDEDMPLSGNVLENDGDIDGGTLTATLGEGPANGMVELNADGSFTYTPNADFNGDDTFTYTVDDGVGGTAMATVSIVVNAANDSPVAVADALSSDEDSPVSGNVLTNDTDADGDSLTAVLGDAPTSGTVEMNTDGSFTYTPNADFNGNDSFTYTVDDGNGGTATGTVSITINAVDDAPIAGEDAFATEEDVPASGNVLLNDTDVDGDSLVSSLAEGPTNGTVELNSDGSFTYTPNADFNGSDSFTYTIDDGNGGTASGLVNITVNAVDDGPQVVDDAFVTNEDVPAIIPIADLLSNDNGGDNGELPVFVAAGGAVNGTVKVDGENVVFTPSPDFNGTGSFTYAVQGANGEYAFAHVTVTVDAVPDAPIAGDDVVSTAQGTPLTIAASDLLTNDTDADGDSLSITAVGGASGGTVSLVDGNITFTPDAEFNGVGTFYYTVTDGNGGNALGMVSVEVTPAAPENTLPEAVDDAVETSQDSPAMMAAADLLANDLDADGDALSLLSVGEAVSGEVSLADGIVTFTPQAGFTGAATFTYTISDGRGGEDTGMVTVNVTPGEDSGDDQPGDDNPGDDQPGGDQGDDQPGDELPGEDQPGNQLPGDDSFGDNGSENPEDPNHCDTQLASQLRSRWLHLSRHWQ